MRFRATFLLPSLLAAFSSLTASSRSITAVLQEQFSAHNIQVLFPDDAGYVAASQPYNLRFTVFPVAITYPTTVEQISTVVKVGASQKLNVVARSGGHSYIANSLGGKNGSLVVDLSKMTNIIIDAVTFNAIIETGNRLGDIALTLNDAGRGLPHGRCTYVGIGGHSGFGGYGYASRMWGMTLDNVLSATVVLANGSIVDVSENSYPELYWGVRGSSASLGIVASVEFRTFPVPPSGTAFEFAWYMDIPTASEAFIQYQEWALSGAIPPEFGGELIIEKGLEYGQVAFGFIGNYFGPAENFSATIAPFFNTLPTGDTMILANVTQGTWIEVLAAIAVGDLNTTTQPESKDTYYAKSLMAPQDLPLTNASMTALITYLAQEGFNNSDFWHVEVELYGGNTSLINQVSLNDTAFAHRNTLFTFQLWASSSNLLPPYPSNSFDFVDGMVSSLLMNMPNDWSWGAYPNYLDDRLLDWQQRYYGSHYERLQALKLSVDPLNIFRFPTSIQE